MSPRQRPAWLTALVVLALSAPGCSKDEPSNLERMSKDPGSQPEVADGSPSQDNDGTARPNDGAAADTAAADAPAPASTLPLDDKGIPIPALEGAPALLSAGAEQLRVDLRLALVEGRRYRLTTIGMLTLPLVQRGTGFAHEEQLELSQCSGEGSERSCLLTHRSTNFEAEPPAGKVLEGEQARIAELETAHRIDASGLRSSATQVSGPAEALALPDGKALAEVHRMYCIRLPAEPVGEGAVWRDTCRLRQGGAIVTRELTWRVKSIASGDEGTRVELGYAGTIKSTSKEGRRDGRVEGELFFWADAGEPHMLRERLAFTIDSSRGLSSTTDLRVQFATYGEDGETLLRTDGNPFAEGPRVLNDPRRTPNGATRDGELPDSASPPAGPDPS